MIQRERTEKLEFADGTVVNGSCGYTEHHLWLWLKDLTMAEVLAIVTDPNKTSTIKYYLNDKPEPNAVYENFTVMNSIFTRENSIDVRMVQPVS